MVMLFAKSIELNSRLCKSTQLGQDTHHFHQKNIKINYWRGKWRNNGEREKAETLIISGIPPFMA